MSPGYWWSISGLTSDIVGASLLAVEAIKLENLRKLVATMRTSLLIPPESPLIVILEREPGGLVPPILADHPALSPENLRRGFGGHPVPYVAAHLLVGWALLAAAVALIHFIFHYPLLQYINYYILSRPTWLTLVLYAALGVALLVLGYLLGEFGIHVLLERAIRGAMGTLVMIDRNTPSGTIGIVGFFLMFAGFAGQIMATILNG